LGNKSPTWRLAFLEAIEQLSRAPLAHGLAPESEQLQREIHHHFLDLKDGGRYRFLFVRDRDDIVLLRLAGVI
jgi:hypothetical protein